MKATITHGNKQYLIDLSNPIDLSIPLRNGKENLTAWYSDPPSFKAVESEGFIGDVSRGGSVNFRNIFFNPHAHGTHTECVGHISDGGETINETVQAFFHLAQVITIQPQQLANGDAVITLNQLKSMFVRGQSTAVVIRTLPNDVEKKGKQYSHTNPPYVEHLAMTFLVEEGIEHFLIDLPSVDKENDNGALQAHKAFWQYPEIINKKRTITEFIYVQNEVIDGLYVLNLQIVNFQNDAAPSRPVLYAIQS